MSEESSCCDVCGKSISSPKLCTRCRDRTFCSVECQKSDWPAHKKKCTPNYRRELMGLIDRAIQDDALTPIEIKTMKLNFHRVEGNYYYYNLRDLQGCDTPYLRDLSEDDIRKYRVDANCIDAMSILLDINRGVMVQMKGEPPKFGFIAPKEPFDDKKIYHLWKKKKMLTVLVKLSSVLNGQDPNDDQGGEVIAVEPHRLRLVPIKDTRHVRDSAVNRPIPLGIDPDEFVVGADCLPEGVKWQFLRNDEWVDYPKGLACRIESSYLENSSHFLYSPGNPHNRDQYTRNTMMALAGRLTPEDMLRMHDTCTRQIIFEVSSRGVWVSGSHTQTSNMTERDLFTTMQWRVRRLGGEPRVGGNDEQRKRLYLFGEGVVDWHDTREKCDLCFKTDGPLLTLPCCGARVCDTENQYMLGSYTREGQCMRNHLLNSICGHHHKKGHGGSWKDCSQCEGDFHPYDYAVKATSIHASSTVRRYNSDNNVRTDIHPADVPFPQCSQCNVSMETTEENTETLGQRRSLGVNTKCARCGMGYGVVMGHPF